MKYLILAFLLLAGSARAQSAEPECIFNGEFLICPSNIISSQASICHQDPKYGITLICEPYIPRTPLQRALDICDKHVFTVTIGAVIDESYLNDCERLAKMAAEEQAQQQAAAAKTTAAQDAADRKFVSDVAEGRIK